MHSDQAIDSNGLSQQINFNSTAAQVAAQQFQITMKHPMDQEVQYRLNKFWNEIGPAILDEATEAIDKDDMHDCQQVTEFIPGIMQHLF